MANSFVVLSAGAVKPGLSKVIDAFRKTSGMDVQVSFATAPAILQQLGSGVQVDVVIAPEEVLEKLSKAGHCAADETVEVGRIGVGVLVRQGRTLPQIGTVDDFKRTLLAAESLVYNQASTGAYLEKLFVSLGVADAVKDKSTRYPDFGAVLDHILRGGGEEIGFGATTVIVESENRGVKFAGPLPAEIQNYTSYFAAVIASGKSPEQSRQFIRHLAAPEARSILAAAGIQ